VLGIELNEYAAELARVTVWIGELQWRIEHGYEFKTNPVLDTLEHIECRDALLAEGGAEAAWPAADVVVGNPPFLGVSRKRGELGEAYTQALDTVYAARVPGAADLVCYWFDKARAQMAAGALQRAGLVTTNSIRGGANRKALDAICTQTRIFEAWSDEPWVNNGAAVRVSLVCFGAGEGAHLNGTDVPQIYADLTAPATAGDSLNLGLALMVAIDLFPVGIAQLNDVLEHGLWHARSQAFVQGELFQRLTWARVIGGALFTLGGVLPMAWFLVSRFGSLKAVAASPLSTPDKPAMVDRILQTE